MFKYIYIIIVFLTLNVIETYSQCAITAYANATTNTVTICLGNSVTLTAIGTCPNYILNTDNNDKTPPTIHVWWSNGAKGFNPNEVYPTANTKYTVYLTDGIDTVHNSVNVVVNSIPTSAFTVTSSVCIGSLSTITYTGSAAASATYAWYFDGGIILSGSGQGPYQVLWDKIGKHNLTLGLNENGCLAIPSVVDLIVNPKPIIPDITFTPACLGGDLQLFASTIPNATYSWFGPNSFSSTLQNPVVSDITQSCAGSYSVSITDANGCVSDINDTTVTILPLPIVSFNATPTSGCEPLTVNFNNTTSSSNAFFWQFGDSGIDTVGNPIHVYNNDGSYSVTLTVTDNNGCSNQLTHNNQITVYPLPEANFTTNPQVGAPNTLVAFNSSFTAAMGTWYWDFGDGTTETLQIPTTQHSSVNMGSFNITHIVESQYGCKDTVVKTFLVIKIAIPNVFTPNGDGLNDKFVIDGIEQISGTTLIVFNRWGKKFFESTDYKNDWEGNDASDGVYYYIITFKDNFIESANGIVTILR